MFFFKIIVPLKERFPTRDLGGGAGLAASSWLIRHRPNLAATRTYQPARKVFNLEEKGGVMEVIVISSDSGGRYLFVFSSMSCFLLFFRDAEEPMELSFEDALKEILEELVKAEETVKDISEHVLPKVRLGNLGSGARVAAVGYLQRHLKRHEATHSGIRLHACMNVVLNRAGRSNGATNVRIGTMLNFTKKEMANFYWKIKSLKNYSKKIISAVDHWLPNTILYAKLFLFKAFKNSSCSECAMFCLHSALSNAPSP